jgi:large subunit ribosomal protein L10
MVATWKIKEVENLAERISKSKVVGLIDINGIPSKQFQQMRKGLTGKAQIRVTRGSIMKRAFEKAKLKDFDKYVQGSMGVVFTDLDPFRLNKLMKSSKTSAPAKPGSIANKDIVVPAGDTPFKPGPIIGDLQKVGVKAKIEGGKIIVTDDSLVVSEGEVISADLANVLTRLGIEPLEIGLEINAAYEDKIIYSGDILSIDEEKIIADMQKAYQQSLNLALNAGIYNSATINLFLRQAFSDAISLAINAEIINKETIGLMLSKANMQMLSLASKIPEGIDDELKGSVSSASAAAKAEEPKAEAKEGKKKKPKEEEKADEGGAASGMAALFG